MCVYLSLVNIECDPASQVQTILSVLLLTSAVRPTIFQTVQRAQGRKATTLQVGLRVLCCVGAGIVECLKGWRCMVGGWRGVGEMMCGRGEECGGKGEGVWWERQDVW